MGTVEENKEVVRQFIERVYNQGDTSSLDELFTMNFVSHSLTIVPCRDGNLEQLKQFHEGLPDNWSDVSATIEDMITEEDKISISMTVNGTRDGKYVVTPHLSIFRIQEGKITEMWDLYNQLSHFQQLDFLPSTEEIVKNATTPTN